MFAIILKVYLSFPSGLLCVYENDPTLEFQPQNLILAGILQDKKSHIRSNFGSSPAV